MWCTEEFVTTATHRMQTSVKALATWARKWNDQTNKRNHPLHCSLRLSRRQGTSLLTTYIGVTYDRRQTWTPHIQKAETKAKSKLSLLRY